MTSSPLSCPRCNGDPHIKREIEYTGEQFRVGCSDKCRLSETRVSGTVEDAVQAWNRYVEKHTTGNTWLSMFRLLEDCGFSWSGIDSLTSDEAEEYIRETIQQLQSRAAQIDSLQSDLEKARAEVGRLGLELDQCRAARATEYRDRLNQQAQIERLVLRVNEAEQK